jgi:CheY-like chemotaxis protein
VETARQIRQHYGSEKLVIIMTAYTWDTIREEALAAGIDGFLAKPIFATNVMEEFKHIVHPLGGKHILVAEDIEMNAEILMDILEMEDMTADHAENGKIALEKFKENAAGTYNAILMDIRMPEMDGLEATAAIRALDRKDAKTIPIIALTAKTFDEDVQRSLQAGINAHLSKPVEPDHLYQTLGELIYEAEESDSKV